MWTALKHISYCGVSMLFLFILFFSGFSVSALEKEKISIGVREVTPFVFKNGDNYDGFSIELMQEIANRANIEIEKTTTYKNVGDLIEAVQNKEVDAGIAAISITQDRALKIDFTQPMFDSGLKIVVNSNKTVQSNNSNIFAKMWTVLTSSEFLWLVIITLLIALVPAHIMYFIEGISDKGMFSKNYFVGIAQSFGWMLHTIALGPSSQANTIFGKIISMVWVYLGIIFVAFFTATITTDLTTEKLQGTINSISDLPGKSVISIKNSTASGYLSKSNIDHVTAENIDEAFDKVSSGEVDAFVYDAPILDYYNSNKGLGKTSVIGEKLQEEGYGIAIPKNSELRTKFDIALLSLKEDGTYNKIYEKWFGKKL